MRKARTAIESSKSSLLMGNPDEYANDMLILEADAVVGLGDGRWGAFKIELGTSHYDEAAKNLLKLGAPVDEERMEPPSFLAILTANNFSFKGGRGIRRISRQLGTVNRVYMLFI